MAEAGEDETLAGLGSGRAAGPDRVSDLPRPGRAGGDRRRARSSSGSPPKSAPNTAWNFRHLAANGFYDDTTFHRVVHFDRTGRRFVIQGGDPSGTGEGSAGWDLPMENSTLAHDLGVISMARADHPDSAGSQFFFCLGTRRDGPARRAVLRVRVSRWMARRRSPRRRTWRSRTPPRASRPPRRVITRMSLVPAPPQDPGHRAIRSPDRRRGGLPRSKDTSDERRSRLSGTRRRQTNDRPFECLGTRRGGLCRLG